MNKKITKLNTILNMIVATFAAMLLGMFLGLFNLPCWFICGMVAMCAVIIEHLLTLHPINLEEKCKIIYTKIKSKVSSWKN